MKLSRRNLLGTLAGIIAAPALQLLPEERTIHTSGFVQTLPATIMGPDGITTSNGTPGSYTVAWYDSKGRQITLADECAMLSEPALSRLWDTPEEDAAWAYLSA